MQPQGGKEKGMRTVAGRLIWGGVFFALAFCMRFASAQSLEIYYVERPPYCYTTKDGQPAGVLIERAQRAFAKAGISVQPVSRPAKRVLQIIQQGHDPAAAIGWFKDDERLKWAKFSTVLYHDQPLVALHTKNPKPGLGGQSSLESLFSDPLLLLGVIGGYSYGASVDEKIRRLNPAVFEVVGDQVQLINMVAVGRVDYILARLEEVHYLLAEMGDDGSTLDFTLLSDVPEGTERYIMFSRAVDDALIARINKALEAEGAAQNDFH